MFSHILLQSLTMGSTAVSLSTIYTFTSWEEGNSTGLQDK